jgi:hypothetical protein
MPPHPLHSHDDSLSWSQLGARQTSSPSSSPNDDSDLSAALPTGAYVGMALVIVVLILSWLWCIWRMERCLPREYTLLRRMCLPRRIPQNKRRDPPRRIPRDEAPDSPLPRDETLGPPPAYTATSAPIQAIEPIHMAVGPDLLRRDGKH